MKKIKTILVMLLCCMLMVGCSSASSTTITEPETQTVFTGTGTGKNGDVKVTTVIENGVITSVTVDEHSETEGIADAALENIPFEIVEYQSLAVDSVAGATLTSVAIIDAVADCIAQAGLNKDDYMKEVVKAEVSVEDATCDVLVLGGGGAGMVAAIYAAESGVNVILVEKNGQLGGNTAMARGVFGASNSSYQIEQGINVTVEDHIANYMKSYPNGDEAMLTILATNSGEAANWLIENGVEFDGVQGNFTLVPAGHRLGSSIMNFTTDLLEKDNVDVRVNTKGTSLITENGAVVGAVVETAGKSYTIHATSVVMATGGFAANNEMVAEYVPYYEGLGYICTGSDEGDGHKMAAEIGAAMAYMDVQKANPFLYLDEATGAYTMIGTYVNPGIVVSTEGKRIGNEHANYYFSPAIMTQDLDVYLIYNEAVRGALEAPDVTDVQYETIDELAEATGINAETLKETMAAYAQNTTGTPDEFGRTLFVNTLEEGPYYAVKLTPAMQGTFGGILINENTEAISTEGNVISGLYAAGECAGDGLYGANPVPTDMVFGKIAGTNAAANALN